MRAVVVPAFGVAPELMTVPDPAPAPDGVVVAVAATGVCRSDWHAWQGHDDGVRVPFVPGHELAGTVVEVGADVDRAWVGRRVSCPFVCACGTCAACRAGEQQVCRRQEQPGFTHDGSYAEYVALRYAAVNLVALPERVGFDVGALLGCRVATGWRAVHHRARVRAGQTVVVLGCGGLGLAVIRIAVAAGARVIAVDPGPDPRRGAQRSGADTVLPSGDGLSGADVTLDCAGTAASAGAALRCLRPRGRHVQVGLLPGGAHLPMDVVIAREIDVLGSHGMPSHHYPTMLAGLERLDLGSLIERRVTLDDAVRVLTDTGHHRGITVVHPGDGRAAGLPVRQSGHP